MELNAKNQNYRIGISFTGKHRLFVRSIMNEILKVGFVKNEVFFDEYHEEVVNGPNADTRFRRIYSEKCDYIIVFLSDDYNTKFWTGGVEWKAIREIINKKQDKICLLNADNIDINTVDGLSSYTDIAKNINTMLPSNVAKFIKKWYDYKQTSMS